MSLVSETEYDSLMPVEAPQPQTAGRSSMAMVSIACAAAVMFALVGAVFAVVPDKADAGSRGDRIAEASAPGPTLTVEDANVDAGFSNLTMVPATPARVAMR